MVAFFFACVDIDIYNIFEKRVDVIDWTTNVNKDPTRQ